MDDHSEGTESNDTQGSPVSSNNAPISDRPINTTISAEMDDFETLAPLGHFPKLHTYKKSNLDQVPFRNELGEMARRPGTTTSIKNDTTNSSTSTVSSSSSSSSSNNMNSNSLEPIREHQGGSQRRLLLLQEDEEEEVDDDETLTIHSEEEEELDHGLMEDPNDDSNLDDSSAYMEDKEDFLSNSLQALQLDPSSQQEYLVTDPIHNRNLNNNNHDDDDDDDEHPTAIPIFNQTQPDHVHDIFTTLDNKHEMATIEPSFSQDDDVSEQLRLFDLSHNSITSTPNPIPSQEAQSNDLTPQDYHPSMERLQKHISNHNKKLTIPNLSFLSEDKASDHFETNPAIAKASTTNTIPTSKIQLRRSSSSELSPNHTPSNNAATTPHPERPSSPFPGSPQQSIQDEDSIAVYSEKTFPMSNVTQPNSSDLDEDGPFPIHSVATQTNPSSTTTQKGETRMIQATDSFESDIQDLVVSSHDMVPASPMSATFPDRVEYLEQEDPFQNAPEIPSFDTTPTASTNTNTPPKILIHHDAAQILEMETLDGKPHEWDPELDDDLEPYISDEPILLSPSPSLSSKATPHPNTNTSTMEDLQSTTSSVDGKRTINTTDSVTAEGTLITTAATLQDPTPPTSSLSSDHSYLKHFSASPKSTSLPDSNFVRNTGLIYTRTTWRSLLMRKWQRSVWVHYGRSSLYIFRCEEDVNSWLIGPKLTMKQRDALIRVKFDFLHEINKPQVRGYKLTSNKAKVYEKNGPLFYNFKLEKWLELDKHVAAAFAAPNKKDLETLRKVVRSCLDNCPHKGLKNIQDLLIEEKSLSSPMRNSRTSRT